MERNALKERKLDFKIIGAHASYSSGISGTSCQAIIIGKEIYLLDCGFGALSGLFRKGIIPERIKGIMITHTHLDHVGGLPELLWFRENRGIKEPLKVISPEEIPGLPFPVEYVSEFPNLPPLTIIPLNHRVSCQGYRIGDEYAYITDTLPDFTKLANSLKGVRTLYHEATYDNSGKEKAKKWMHSTGAQAALVAKIAGVEKLIIGHVSHAVNPKRVLEEAREIFKETYLPE